MHTRTAKLHKIMEDNGLKAGDVAEMLDRETITIRIWRCKSSTRVIPADALRLLELELIAKAAA